MEIIARKHLSVQTELYLLVAVNINRLGLAVNEVFAGLGVIQVVAYGVYLEQSQESQQGCGLAT